MSYFVRSPTNDWARHETALEVAASHGVSCMQRRIGCDGYAWDASFGVCSAALQRVGGERDERSQCRLEPYRGSSRLQGRGAADHRLVAGAR